MFLYRHRGFRDADDVLLRPRARVDLARGFCERQHLRLRRHHHRRRLRRKIAQIIQTVTHDVLHAFHRRIHALIRDGTAQRAHAREGCVVRLGRELRALKVLRRPFRRARHKVAV